MRPEVDLAWPFVCGLHPVWWVCSGCVYIYTRGHVVDGASATCTWAVVFLVPQVHL